jgi:hypothetical protein
MKTMLDKPTYFVRFTAWAAENYPKFTVHYPTNVQARWAFRKACRTNPTLCL